MKRLLSAVLAICIAGATAAQADPYRGYHHGYDRHWGGRHHDDTGALVAAGIGLFALTAILASQHDRDRPAVYEREDPQPYYGPAPYQDRYSGWDDRQPQYQPDERYAPQDGRSQDDRGQYGWQQDREQQNSEPWPQRR
jgi:hypothetical protein